MWIQSTREAHAGNQFKDPRVADLNDGAPVSFNDNGTAQVSAALGEYLTSEYDVFVATDDDGDADAETDTEDDADDETTAAVAADPDGANETPEGDTTDEINY